MKSNLPPQRRKLIAAILIANIFVLSAFSFSVFILSLNSSIPQILKIFAFLLLWLTVGVSITYLISLIFKKDSERSTVLESANKGYENKILDFEQEVARLKANQKNLIDQKEEAIRSSTQKSEFLANMSHEIRTPMTGVLGMADLLGDTTLSEEQSAFVQTIRNSGESLLTIINDILDFSKIESGNLEMESLGFNLRRSLEEVLELVIHKANQKQVEVILDYHKDVPDWIYSDVTRVKQIATNLLSNGIKFTESGEIVVQVTSKLVGNFHQIQFAVKDTGIGIPPDRLHRLFQSYSQVDSSTARHYGGTGLGLVISKRLAELMGGTMWVESEENVGSTFYFTIQAEKATAEDTALSIHHISKLSGKKALIIMPNQTSRRVVEGFLDEWGVLYDSIPSLQKDELPSCLTPQNYDLIIADFKLKAISNLEWLKDFAAQKAIPPEIFLFVTINDLETKDSLKDAHITKSLYKPIKKIPFFWAMVRSFMPPEPDKNESKIKHTKDLELFADTYPLKILLAEDNIVNQKVALRTLSRLGYSIDLAANGVQAVELAGKTHYDIILMDIHMPEMDGIEATQIILQGSIIKPKIIALTAGVMEDERESCIQAGMDAFVMKPFKAQDISNLFKEISKEQEKIFELS